MIEHVSVKDLKDLIEKNNCQVVDVREIHEYQSVRIPSSVLVPLSEFEKKMNLIDRTSPSYFLCGVGKRALKAAEFLETIGYKNLFVIDGGLKSWLEAGYPVECD